MSGEYGTGTMHGNLPCDPARQQPLVSNPLWGNAAAQAVTSWRPFPVPAWSLEAECFL